MGFSQNLKNEFAYAGISAKELSKKSGVNPHALNNYLSKNQIPSVETGVKIARALGVTAEYLVSGKDREKDGPELRAIHRHAKTLTASQRKIALEIIKLVTQGAVGEN